MKGNQDMYVLIPVLLSAVCAFINPYVGLFGLFTVVEFIILLCVDINAAVRVKMGLKAGENTPAGGDSLARSGKILATAECVLVIFFTVVTAIVSIGVWMLASGNLTGETVVMTPVRIFSEEDTTAAIVLLVAGIVFQISAVFLAFVRRRKIIYSIREI